ncbi:MULTISPECIES: hypothetical protein [Methanosarcina]|nr:hypothetical protein [Methanosarcina mazei]
MALPADDQQKTTEKLHKKKVTDEFILALRKTEYKTGHYRK